MASVSARRKSRLGKFFHRNHDEASSSGHHVHPSISTGASGPADSAYASSENNDLSKRSHDLVPVASGDDRNLAMNENTGEVVDEDTGEVVTVTTTTTTTTTTKTKGGKTTNVQVETTPGNGAASGAGVVEAPGDTPASGPRVSPNPAIAQPQPQHAPQPPPQLSEQSFPPLPTQSSHSRNPPDHSMNSRIPTMGSDAPYSENSDNASSHQQAPSQHPSEPKSRPQFIPYHPRNSRKSPSEQQDDPAGPSVAIPERNPNRNFSREENKLNDPVSPVGSDTPTQQNFSYPRSNQNLRGDLPAGAINNTVPEGQPRRQSVFENLKAAAVGLHGVGETIRGTLNSEIDARYPRRNAEKAAAANAKNAGVLSRGEREMAGVRHEQGLTATTSDSDHQVPVRDSGEDWHDNGQGEEVKVEEQKGGFRRLLRRRPRSESNSPGQ